MQIETANSEFYLYYAKVLAIQLLNFFRCDLLIFFSAFLQEEENLLYWREESWLC